ncbi:MAG: phosphohydrolase [Bacteroidota bacterium]
MAIQIFKDEYPKKFLHQLISSQLDMDRLDYLNRDSFFTGVHEGVVGYHRLIQMLSVYDNELVVEEKGILSIEKFLVARRMMYWQVYLHKTVLSAEQMLIRAFRRAKDLANAGFDLQVPKSLALFLNHEIRREDFVKNRDLLLDNFARLDDFDIVSALKNFQECGDRLLAFISHSIIDRRLFRLILQNEPFTQAEIRTVEEQVKKEYSFSKEEIPYLVFSGHETNAAYSTSKAEINILLKDGSVKPMSEVSDYQVQSKLITKYYLCYPKSPA